MDITNYSPENGESTGVEIARESPMDEGLWLIPAFATPSAKPETGPGYTAVFLDANGVPPRSYTDGTWSTVIDERGQYWRTATGEVAYLDDLGVTAASQGLTGLEPIENGKWDGAAWVPDQDKINAQFNAGIQYQIRVIEVTEQPAAQRLFAVKGDNSAMVAIQEKIDALTAQLR